MYTPFETRYVSSNCNGTPTAMDWGKNDLICYTSANAVMVYDYKIGTGGKVTCVTAHHKNGRVNSVRWIRGKDVNETEIVSGAADGTTLVWRIDGPPCYIEDLQAPKKSSVTMVDGLYKSSNNEDCILVTTSLDSTVNFWHRKTLTDNFKLQQTINLERRLCTGLRLEFLPYSDDIVLALGLDNGFVDILIEEQGIFKHKIYLKGHTDWVRGLDFRAEETPGHFLLATCSQDTQIRIWRFTKREPTTNISEKLEKLILDSQNACFDIELDSIITCHEGWVYSVNWSPTSMHLLSTSIDKTMIIWQYDGFMWDEKARMGEVGGNTLGFFGGVYSPDGKKILGYTYHGAFHIWTHTQENEKGARWEPKVTIGGHFDAVTDVAWEPKGEFVVSLSADETTRIHGPWRRDDTELATWHEIARPQVHGYGLNSLAMISRYQFASAAEEKVIRVFQAPKNYVENCRRICKISDDLEGDDILNSQHSEPKGASVPSLGLSNKAVYIDDNIEATVVDNKNPYPEESHFVSKEMMEPPTEETLLENTLWPETQKLYGHGYEVYSLAVSPDKKFLASACKATTIEHAAILIWDTATWNQVQKLTSHTLTVVQMRFSPDSQFLLSVSRDRRWSLFKRNLEANGYELHATTSKTNQVHLRIIWTCSWSHDSKFFATGSRDRRVVLWTRNPAKTIQDNLADVEVVSKDFLSKDAVTALAFAPGLVRGSYMLAVGNEAGVIEILMWTNEQKWTSFCTLFQRDAHHKAVKGLAFRPIFGEAGSRDEDKEGVLQLASCGMDNAVKITTIYPAYLRESPLE